MRFLLDTNVISDIVRNPGGKAAAAYEARLDDCCTSIIVACEIRFGIAKSPAAAVSVRAASFLAGIVTEPFEPPAEEAYGRLRAELERLGNPIGANDLFIAAHSLALDCILVTANEREFRRVPGLRVENWIA